MHVSRSAAHAPSAPWSRVYLNCTGDLIFTRVCVHVCVCACAAATIVGLYLLYLLSQNQIAEFHTELELVSHRSGGTLITHPCIRYVINLEQQLQEGCYNKVLGATQQVPHAAYLSFMEVLAHTVR